MAALVRFSRKLCLNSRFLQIVANQCFQRVSVLPALATVEAGVVGSVLVVLQDSHIDAFRVPDALSEIIEAM
jgi:hypothetical protein